MRNSEKCMMTLKRRKLLRSNSMNTYSSEPGKRKRRTVLSILILYLLHVRTQAISCSHLCTSVRSAITKFYTNVFYGALGNQLERATYINTCSIRRVNYLTTLSYFHLTDILAFPHKLASKMSSRGLWIFTPFLSMVCLNWLKPHLLKNRKTLRYRSWLLVVRNYGRQLNSTLRCSMSGISLYPHEKRRATKLFCQP